MNTFDIQYGLELPNGHRVHVISSKKRLRSLYKFFDEELELIQEIEGDTPLNLTKQSKVGKLIFKSLLSVKSPKKEFSELCNALAEFQDYIETTQEEMDEKKRMEEKKAHQRKIDNAMGIYEGLENPIIYIASCIDWLTAGERANILISFFTLCSQVVLRHPISLIGVGEGSSGKNHVCESAIMMLPSEFVVHEKKPTLASMFRRSEIDPYYYDGKIVNYGDMGGDSDQEEVEETKSILKELQTDGMVNRPVTVKTEDGFEVVDLCLWGNPCLVYQTVPNYSFDDQELSRSMITTPRTDNRKEYNLMMQYLELKGGSTAQTHDKFRTKLSEFMPLVVEGLRDRYEHIDIVNPYVEVIEEFIGDNPHYKRDLPKLNSILKVITAFNGVNRPIHDNNGHKILFTNREDVSFFLTLFDDYHSAISLSITPKAMDILRDLRENLDNWTYNFEEDKEVFTGGISINRYMEIGNVKLSYRSVSRYFTELKQNGLLTIVGKEGNSNLYSTVDDKKRNSKIDFKPLSEESKNIILSEYDEKLLNSILSDSSDDRKSIFEQDSSISIPPWMVK